MSKYIFICVFCLILFSINCAAEGQESPENFKKTQLLWNQWFGKINERLARLESDFNEEKKQRQKFINKINDRLDKQEEMLLTMSKVSQDRNTHNESESVVAA